MGPKIRDFKEIEAYVKTSPGEAAKIAAAWDVFMKDLKTSHPELVPEVARFTEAKQFTAWASAHPDIHINPSVWKGKEVTDAYFYVRDAHEDRQIEEHGSFDPDSLPGDLASDLLAPLGLLFNKRARLMEEDENYKKIANEKWDAWLKENPGKDLTTQEGLDYYYGSIDHPTDRSLHKDSEEAFRENKDFTDKVERYDKEKKKMYKNAKKDPAMQLQEQLTQEEIQARYAFLKKQNPEIQLDDVAKQVQDASWKRFAWKYEEKATAYKETHTGIAKIYDGVQINRQLAKGEKDIKYVEKTHREEKKDTPSAQGTIDILERINKEREQQASTDVQKLYVEPRGTIRERIQYQPEQDEDQRQQSQPDIQIPKEASQPSPEPSSEPPRPSPSSSPPRPTNSPRIPPGLGRANKAAANLGRKALAGAGRAIGSALAATSEFWVPALVVLIIIIVIIIVISGVKNEEKKPVTATQIPGLTLTLTGPATVKNGQEINYAIAVTYAGPLEVVIKDPIPANSTFDAATGKYEIINNVVTWKLNDNIGSEITHIYEFGVAFKPNNEDSIVNNKIFAVSLGSPGNPNATDFDTLMAGQGRNILALGDEDAFTTRVLQNGVQYGLHTKESYIRQIYKAAAAKNVNPLAVLATWGTEQGFGAAQRAFSCPPRLSNGFDDQLACAVNTWNMWMNFFDQNKGADDTFTLQSSIPGNTCIYSDAFLFAAEKYGPVCTVYDANDFFHSNFVKYYRHFLVQ